MILLTCHLQSYYILPLVGSGRLSWHHPQFTRGPAVHDLEVKRLISIRVKRCKRRQNEGLTVYAILQRKLEDSKMPLEDTEYPLDGIAS